MEYNLEKRTKLFGIEVIRFVNSISKNNINAIIINQLVRSATSIGANYCEANGASSKRDFKNKIYICKKEARETKYWLELLSQTNTRYREKIRLLNRRFI
ncbi:MAG: four helix bundle protein [Parcubacteria group bacterium]|nr:four helix bundle protein [Parcubacteria group bacterium]